ncbi:MAG: hypothetical protein NT041_02125, partial [Candidatus Vogelbacteria bacterium]|nr:hypothetical protein [Candidatus Vogelbacteria bacterium]
TVIACGFSNDGKKSRDDFKIIDSTEPKKENLTLKEEPVKTKTEPEDGKLVGGLETKITTNSNGLNNLTKDKKDDAYEDDDWSSIPAFLRRSKTK